MVDRGRMRRHLIALLALCWSGGAIAQISAQVSLASDYIYRGVTLTDNRPTAMVELNYDSPNGWFASGLATETRFFGERHYEPEYVVDAGYAHALAAGLTWEAGASYSVFSKATFWNYSEAFVGVLGEHWNARLYYSPDYFGRGRRTWYAQFDYAQPLVEHWNLIGHVGSFKSSGGEEDPHGHTFDASLGIAAKFGSASFELKRSIADHDNYLYPLAPTTRRDNWIVSVAYSY